MATTPSSPNPSEHLLFVCDSLLRGEPDHELLASARALGEAKTEPGFQLVEMGPTGGLLQGGAGTGHVVGELYAVDRATLAAIDVRRGHPMLHQRAAIRLSDGRVAQAYTVNESQVRGRRRIRGGDWRARFGGAGAGAERRHDAGPLVSWARDRFRR